VATLNDAASKRAVSLVHHVEASWRRHNMAMNSTACRLINQHDDQRRLGIHLVSEHGPFARLDIQTDHGTSGLVTLSRPSE
jgi:hypothetical protein